MWARNFLHWRLETELSTVDFFLTLPPLLAPVKERTKWVVTDMVDPSNPPSLMQEISIWFWCEESLHVFLPGPDPRYSFLWWHSQRDNGCEICLSHIHQNVFFIFSFLSLFPFLNRAHKDFAQGPRSGSKLHTRSTALHKTFCDTKCKRRQGGWGEENKSNNSEHQRLSQCS